MRKKLFYVLIAVFIIQLAVPAYMIGYSLYFHEKIETVGKEYYVQIEPYGVTNENEVLFNSYRCEYYESKEILNQRQYIYALLDVDENGIAYVSDITYEKPETHYYIKTERPYTDWVFPSISYKTNEYTGSALSDHIKENDYYYWGNHSASSDTYYARILVYEGKIIVKEILINDTPIEVYFRN